MKAARIDEYGDVSVIHIQEIVKPVVTAGQVLIEVHASSINPFDFKLRAGYMKEMIPLQFPVTLGGDIAGVVTEVGDSVDNVAIGDRVYGQANAVAGNSGAFAEFAATSAGAVAKFPGGLDFNQAASLPLVGVSALQALTRHIGLQSGQRIFIHGGSGGIGTIAIQIAKNIGAYVATTATGESMEVVKQLGADQVIDYKAEDFAETLKDFDAVFDNVGGEDFTKSLRVLKKGGIAVSMVAQADESIKSELGVKAIMQMTKVTSEALDKLRDLVESGIVKPQVGKVFPLDKIQEAFTALETGSVNGKVVVAIQQA